MRRSNDDRQLRHDQLSTKCAALCGTGGSTSSNSALLVVRSSCRDPDLPGSLRRVLAVGMLAVLSFGETELLRLSARPSARV